MNYYELIFTIITTEDYHQDLLINTLGDIGFDTFEEIESGFKAYIPADEFNSDRLEDALNEYREMFSFSYEDKRQDIRSRYFSPAPAGV